MQSIIFPHGLPSIGNHFSPLGSEAQRVKDMRRGPKGRGCEGWGPGEGCPLHVGKKIFDF